MTETVLGIDVGGTALKLGQFDAQGNCLETLTLPTPQPSTPEAVIATIASGVNQLDPQHQAKAIGIGTPGPADPTGRVAIVAINLTDWRNVPLADRLEALTQRPVVIANDANCAGVGEAWRGAGQRFNNLVMLTLGTGVGGAIILNGQLYVGPSGLAGELGLITLNPEGPPCNSGNTGSLEQYASIQAIQRQTGLDPQVWGDRAAAGDPEALDFWQNYGRTLAAGLASIAYILTPEAIVLGGGISASANYFLPALEEELYRRVLLSSPETLPVLPAQLGNQAGMVGAAKLAWDKFLGA
ncbi:MAG: ROK family protein [Prochlorotrichaceae cyanobacterium]